ncbi:MAG: hypothetical protein Q8S13_12555, partial [Dehalococcoidia bacterium]|nr:hypothetical protein [Dehalococcoidia bacterium]
MMGARGQLPGFALQKRRAKHDASAGCAAGDLDPQCPARDPDINEPSRGRPAPHKRDGRGDRSGSACLRFGFDAPFVRPHLKHRAALPGSHDARKVDIGAGRPQPAIAAKPAAHAVHRDARRLAHPTDKMRHAGIHEISVNRGATVAEKPGEFPSDDRNPHIHPDARASPDDGAFHAGGGLNGHRRSGGAGAMRKPGQASDPVAAHGRLAAVRIEDPHP